eukprot:8043702-Ditylum_brightwellii.AAC.1
MEKYGEAPEPKPLEPIMSILMPPSYFNEDLITKEFANLAYDLWNKDTKLTAIDLPLSACCFTIAEIENLMNVKRSWHTIHNDFIHNLDWGMSVAMLSGNYTSLDLQHFFTKMEQHKDP